MPATAIRKVILSDRAANNIAAIRDYIGQDNPAAADRMVDKLVSAVRSLAQFPNRGRTGRIAGTRELVSVRPYIIVYRVGRDRVEISQIRHAAQARSADLPS
jgi:toxin ParE1/3/4